MNVISLVLLIVSIGVNLVGLWFIWSKLTKLENRIDELENLINQYGGIVGEYLDAMNKDNER